MILGGACFSEGPQVICDDPSCETTGGVTTEGSSSSSIDPTAPTGSGADTTSAAASSSESSEPGESSTTPADTSGESTGRPESVCGDGELAPDEACDDMNDAPYDGCDACQVTATLVWQYDFDHQGGNDEVTALAPDGPAVLVGGVVASNISGDDAVWLRVDDGAVAPPAWFHVADLPGNNRLWDIARNPDVCAIGGLVESGDGDPVASANVVACDTGNVGGGLAFAGPEAPGPEDLRALVVRADDGFTVGGWRMHGGVPRGWVAELDVTGQNTLSIEWLDDANAFGDESRVHALWAAGGEVFAAGTSVQGGVNRGFAGPVATLAADPIPFGLDSDASEAVGVVATQESLVVAGWTSDADDRSALVQAFPILGGPPISWTLDLGVDDRALAIAPVAGGFAVTGFTLSMPTDRDLFVVWLDEALEEQARVIFDGPANGSDVGRAIVSDGNDVIVGGHVTIDGSTDLLVQRWSPPQ